MEKGPKKLYFDLETTAREGRFWGPKYETGIVVITKHTKILSFSVKWDGGKQITRGWNSYPNYKKGTDNNERKLVQELHDLMMQADITCAHNGKKFDMRVAMARFAYYGLKPLKPIPLLDTKVEAKKVIDLPSYSLDDIADFFGIIRKLHHSGYDTWTGCEDGDERSWREMLRYNARDVVVLEQVEKRLAPYYKNPQLNMGMFKKGVVCPNINCGSRELNWEGWHRNKTTKYHSFSCKKCGRWGRDTTNIQKIKPMVSI